MAKNGDYFYPLGTVGKEKGIKNTSRMRR